MTANIYGSRKNTDNEGEMNDILTSVQVNIIRLIPKYRNDVLISINEAKFRETCLRGNGHTLMKKHDRSKFVGIYSSGVYQQSCNISVRFHKKYSYDEAIAVTWKSHEYIANFLMTSDPRHQRRYLESNNHKDLTFPIGPDFPFLVAIHLLHTHEHVEIAWETYGQKTRNEVTSTSDEFSDDKTKDLYHELLSLSADNEISYFMDIYDYIFGLTSFERNENKTRRTLSIGAMVYSDDPTLLPFFDVLPTPFRVRVPSDMYKTTAGTSNSGVGFFKHVYRPVDEYPGVYQFTPFGCAFPFDIGCKTISNLEILCTAFPDTPISRVMLYLPGISKTNPECANNLINYRNNCLTEKRSAYRASDVNFFDTYKFQQLLNAVQTEFKSTFEHLTTTGLSSRMETAYDVPNNGNWRTYLLQRCFAHTISVVRQSVRFLPCTPYLYLASTLMTTIIDRASLVLRYVNKELSVEKSYICWNLLEDIVGRISCFYNGNFHSIPFGIVSKKRKILLTSQLQHSFCRHIFLPLLHEPLIKDMLNKRLLHGIDYYDVFIKTLDKDYREKQIPDTMLISDIKKNQVNICFPT